MTGFGNIVSRIPRPLLFAAAALIQIVLIAMMVYDRVGILRQGREITLKSTAVDPRDFLRGDYVTLNYDMSTMPAGALKDQRSTGRGNIVYVELAPDADGNFRGVALHRDADAVTPPNALIKARVVSGATCGSDNHSYCDTLRLQFGLERYFVPEGEGRVIEAARNQGKVSIVAAVTPSGRAAIKRLLVDGKPVYDEPLF